MRYHHIIHFLSKRKSTLKEIKSYLQRQSEIHGYDFTVSDRTFSRDISDIRTLYPMIQIEFDYAEGVYYIEEQVLEDSVKVKLFESFNVFMALNIADQASQYIFFEQRRSSGTEHMHELLGAIRKKKQVELLYSSKWINPSSNRIVEPYGLREYDNRWYVLAVDTQDGILKSFGLDRIQELRVTRRRFQYPQEISIPAFYQHCFGIFHPQEGKPVEVVLSVSPRLKPLINAMPFHSSQMIILDNSKEMQLSLVIYPGWEFIRVVLSYGKEIRVLKPASLARKVKVELSSAMAGYEV